MFEYIELRAEIYLLNLVPSIVLNVSFWEQTRPKWVVFHGITSGSRKGVFI